MLLIPDVSFYQDNNTTPQQIDFAKMKAAGAGGVIIRAGQKNWIDEDFISNWEAAKKAGLWRGSYWFWDSRESPNKQADLWRSVFGNDLPELGAWMDFEEGYQGSYGTEGHARDFATRVSANFPGSVEVGVYTAYYWWIGRIKVMPLFWQSYPLWVAHYDVEHPLIPRPFKSWVFHQYTDSGDGKAYGAESKRIDLNRFDGTAQDLAKVFGLSNSLPQPEPQGLKLNIVLSDNGAVSGTWSK